MWRNKFQSIVSDFQFGFYFHFSSLILPNSELQFLNSQDTPTQTDALDG